MTNKTNQKADANSTTAKPEGFRNKAGDLLEKVGHKISEAGAQKIGQKIRLVQMYTNCTAAVNRKYEYLLHSGVIPVHQK